jgi:hypothetical protein
MVNKPASVTGAAGRFWARLTGAPGPKWGSLSARARRSILFAGGAGLVMAILATLLSVPKAATRPEASTLTAARSAAAGVSPSASVKPSTPAIPSASVAPSAPVLPSAEEPRTPGTLASIDCLAPGSMQRPDPIVSGGRMYVICDHDVKVIDLTNDTVVKTYRSVLHDVPAGCGRGQCPAPLWGMAVHDGVWVDGGSVKRIDLTSGAVTTELPGYSLIGDALGYIWVTNGRRVSRVNPSSGKIVAGFASEPANHWVSASCGLLWGWSADDSSATISRLSLSGKVLWSEKARFELNYDPGRNVQRVAGECWAMEAGAPASEAPGSLVRLGPSCVDYRSPALPAGTQILGDSFWTMTWDTRLNVTHGQRVDPSTWRPRGPVWELPSVFSAAGYLWAQDGETISKLDVPVEQWDHTPAVPLACATT